MNVIRFVMAEIFFLYPEIRLVIVAFVDSMEKKFYGFFLKISWQFGSLHFFLEVFNVFFSFFNLKPHLKILSHF